MVNYIFHKNYIYDLLQVDYFINQFEDHSYKFIFLIIFYIKKPNFFFLINNKFYLYYIKKHF